MTIEAQATKAKINKRHYITLKRSFTAEETINEMKGQSTECERIFANHVSVKRLVSLIYKKLSIYISITTQNV